jgi:hypothetical protein
LNLKKLGVGEVVQNYPALCAMINEEVKTGNAKMAQIRNWKAYFSFDRMGHKFVITNIYDKPRFKNPNTRALELFDYLLAYVLIGQKNKADTNQIEIKCTVRFFSMDLYLAVGMVKDNYKGIEKDIGLLNGMERWLLQQFYQNSNDKMREQLYSALDSMQKRNLLTYKRIHIIAEHDSTQHVKGKNEITPYYHYRNASEYESELILDIESDVKRIWA